MAGEATSEGIESVPSGGMFSPSYDIRAVARFSRQLAVLMDAGIPMVRALKILGRRSSGAGLRNLVQAVTTDVEAGAAFSNALQTHGAGLPPTVVPLVRAGERSGELPGNLRYVADTLDHEAHVRGRITSALLFPGITTLLAVALMLFLLMYVAPLFWNLLTDGGTREPPEMPWLSDLVFTASAVVRSGPGLVLVIGGAAALAFAIWRSLTSRSYFMDYLKLRLPIIGEMVTTASMARFAKTLAALLRSGVPVLESLRLARTTADNLAIEQAIAAMEKSVESGGRLSAPLADYWYIPELAQDMIVIGEESGSMAEMLDNLAAVYKGEVERQQDRLVTLVEPVMILLVGFLVLIVVLGCFLPYISLVTNAAVP